MRAWWRLLLALCAAGYHDGVAVGKPIENGRGDFVPCFCRRCGKAYLDHQE